ncbi:MAG: hypothetical protein EAZ85_06370 [Bacteroidetes bacterium]|nr:MAG: hypothetical protein EAZ85_06370 [Bacteroidota bacterium]TAG86631.1 MAG: hypothetical protein EAZ20_12410 [Bacteroidota bacterium]
MISGSDKTTRFLVGVMMLAGGTYMFLNAVQVYTGFSHSLYNVGKFNITGGMVLIPMIFGIGMIFYDSKNLFGWLLGLGSLAMLVFGVISKTQLQLKNMTSFELIVILVLMIGGLGLFLSSLKGDRN